MFTIRKALPEEYEKVRDFYYALIDHMELLEYKPGWMKGVYPADEYLQSSLEKGELFIGCEEEIVTAMILNSAGNESYKKGKWPRALSDGEYAVIHALGVSPELTRRGYAKRMVAFATEYAREMGKKAIRLDVLGGNVSAERLYPAMGFVHCDTIQMFYEDTGWTDFLLYEYPLTAED